jgi:ATP-dependent RNA helicase DeaD
MTDPFNDHTPAPSPTAGTPIEAAVTAASEAAAPPDNVAPADAPAASVDAAPKGPTFAELGLHADVLRAVDEMGFSEPMPVQSATFPLITAGRDLMVQSRTGSGKTAAFGIPFANGIVNGDDKYVQAIVLLPTRELALQVAAELAKICQYRQITVVPVYGGAPMGRQVEQLRAGGQIVCGTPGRVLDHLRRGTLRLDRVRCAVLDECDEMLSMGFQEDIEAILEKTPTARQTLLFSATVPEGIQRLARRFLRTPEFLKLSGDYVSVHDIRHVYYSIPGIQREEELLRILDFEEPKSAIIFCNTREETGRVAAFLRGKGHDAEAISSDLSQSDRERVLGRMRQGGIKFLVATDVAARGIDIENLSHVFNYTFPEAPEIYIHRTGRTGRAGRKGTAISLIGPTEVGSFYYLKLLYKIKPEERSLPSETEIRSHREGERVQELRRKLDGDPGAEWRALARRLVSAVDGERLVAALLAHSYASVEGMPVVAPPRPAPLAAAANDVQPRTAAPEPRERERERDFGDRDRPRFGDRDRDRPRFGGRDRGPRDRGRPGDRDRPRFGDRDRERGRGPGPGPGAGGGDDRSGRRHERRPPPPLRNDQPPAEREFWEVWSEERAQSEGGGVPPPTGVPAPTPFETTSPGIGGDATRGDAPHDEAPQGDVARLYLNLGRKDGASEKEVRDLLATYAGSPSVMDIDVMNTHTYLNVAPADADRIIEAVTGKEMGGRQLVCEKAKPRRR